MYLYHQTPLAILALVISHLVAPVALHKIRRVPCDTGKECLGPKETRRPAEARRVLSLHPKLHMYDSQDKECSHSVIQNFAIGAIELRDRRQSEC